MPATHGILKTRKHIMMRVNILSCALLVLMVAVRAEDPITNAVKADMAIKDAIFHKTTTPESTVPSPYVPADVIVTIPVTELPMSMAPPVTAGTPPSTTPAPTPTPLKTKCNATQYLASNGTCLACGAKSTSAPYGACNTGSATIVGGRCNNFGACIGTPIGFCLSTAKVACVNNPAYTTDAYCDPPADPATVAALAAYKAANNPAATTTGVLQGAYISSNPSCNFDIDCPIGTWCDGYYKSTGFAGQCQPNC
ncbi:hypothetical protein COCOBI_16-3330 [Coccomyxa sp. Obi]|nr:hypothetical protein COCOBI_16-3330 [Coccomyxa sp. Obi]